MPPAGPSGDSFAVNRICTLSFGHQPQLDLSDVNAFLRNLKSREMICISVFLGEEKSTAVRFRSSVYRAFRIERFDKGYSVIFRAVD